MCSCLLVSTNVLLSVSVCSFVESEIQSSLASQYKCSDVLARRVQERALAAMFGKSVLIFSLLYLFLHAQLRMTPRCLIILCSKYRSVVEYAFSA